MAMSTAIKQISASFPWRAGRKLGEIVGEKVGGRGGRGDARQQQQPSDKQSREPPKGFAAVEVETAGRFESRSDFRDRRCDDERPQPATTQLNGL
jgi:hypothetical protein